MLHNALKWIKNVKASYKNYRSYTIFSDYYVGSWIELVKPDEKRKGVIFWDPRVIPVKYGHLKKGQIAWLKKHYIFILVEYFYGLISEVRKVVGDDFSLFEFLMTKDIYDEIEYSKAGLCNCLPYSYSDLVSDLDDEIDEILNIKKEFDFLKCGVPALYTPFIRGGGSRYVHPLRGIGGVGEPIYHISEINDKSKQMLDNYDDYKPRRILELTSRKKTLKDMRQKLKAAYENYGQEWDGNFEEITGWAPGRPWSCLDVRSIPEL